MLTRLSKGVALPDGRRLPRHQRAGLAKPEAEAETFAHCCSCWPPAWRAEEEMLA